MLRRSLRSFSSIMVGCALLALASPGFAQWGQRDRDDWGRSNQFQTARLIRQAESRSNAFAAMVERNNNGRFGRITEIFDTAGRRLTDNARDLEQQLDVVSREFSSGNSYEVRSDLSNALNTARRINTTMQRRDLNYGVERQWVMLRSDLNRLARAFNLQQV